MEKTKRKRGVSPEPSLDRPATRTKLISNQESNLSLFSADSSLPSMSAAFPSDTAIDFSAESAPDLPPVSEKDASLILVEVGPFKERFLIPKNRTIKKSKYFKNCTKPEWRKEGQAIKLHHISTETLKVFMEWLRYGNFKNQKVEYAEDSDSDWYPEDEVKWHGRNIVGTQANLQNASFAEQVRNFDPRDLTEIYLLADNLVTPCLQKDICDARDAQMEYFKLNCDRDVELAKRLWDSVSNPTKGPLIKACSRACLSMCKIVSGNTRSC